MCLPPLIFYHEIMNASHLIVERCENYQKRSFRNRFNIHGSQGTYQFSIPLAKGKHNQKPISAVQIAYDEDWIRNLERLLSSSYGSAPFFEFYFNPLMSIFNRKYERLYDLNWDLLKFTLSVLSIDTDIRESQQYLTKYDPSLRDLRGMLNPNDASSKYQFKYTQVFNNQPFVSGLTSIVDLIFCYGPESRVVLGEYMGDTPCC